MKKVDIILFSCNRAMQTDLALRSIKDHFKNVGDIFVFYKHKDYDFEKGYDKLFQKNYGLKIYPVYQKNFEVDFKNILVHLQNDYYIGFCDDDVFIRETDCDEILDKIKEEGVSSVSLKIFANEIRHYPGYDAELPEFIETHPYLKWNWRKYYRNDSDFGYPTNVNAMIYPRKYFTELIMPNTFNNPNEMEGSLNMVRPKFKDLVVSFRECRVLNIAVNMVQSHCTTNPHELHYSFSIEDLNNRWLNEEIISIENIYGREVIMTSDEVDYKFIKEK